jgi:hypothetical protein
MPRAFRLCFAVLILVGATASASPLTEAMREVERLRGLTFVRDVTQRTVDREELRALLRAEVVKSVPYSPEQYVSILAAFQLIDSSSPALIDKLLDLYQSQVLAFYDPRSHTYFAVRQLPESMAGLGDAEMLRQSVVMHELTHALQDQRFDASRRDEQLQKDVDAELAYHALLEGEATLVMIDYLLDHAGLSLQAAVDSDMLGNLAAMTAAAEKSIDASTPRYFVESLKFPYIEGLHLVVDGYRRGGWKEIDRMHASPPRSTREVLHREEYFARIGSGVGAPAPGARRPGTAAATPHALTVEHMGEFHWRYFVGDAATGWVDDRVTFLQNAACQMTVIAETEWESEARAAAFESAYVSFLRGRGIEPKVNTRGRSVTVTYGPVE